MVYNILLLYNNITSVFWYGIDIYIQLSKCKNVSISLKHMKFVSRYTLLEYDSIIPLDVTSQMFYHSLDISPFYTTNPNIYKLLNNKSNCYHITKNYTDIHHIPTLDIFTKDSIHDFIKKHPSSKYIIKHTTGYGSLFQNIVTKNNLMNINLKLLKGSIIQPYFTNYKIYSLDIISNRGTIYGELFKKIHNIDGINSMDFILSSIDTTVILDGEFYRTIRKFSKSLLHDMYYSGICELEFIVTDDNKIYFLEINPRISGHICQVNRYNQNAYFNNIIIPYLSFYNIDISPQKMLSNDYTGSTLRHMLRNIYSLCPPVFIIIVLVYCIIIFIIIKNIYNLYRR